MNNFLKHQHLCFLAPYFLPPMSASLTAPSLPFFTVHSDCHSSEQHQPVATLTAAQTLNSDDLLQGKKTVAINHNGAIYRLQATRLGKLILTK